MIGKIILYFFEKTLDKGKDICYYYTNLLGRWINQNDKSKQREENPLWKTPRLLIWCVCVICVCVCLRAFVRVFRLKQIKRYFCRIRFVFCREIHLEFLGYYFTIGGHIMKNLFELLIRANFRFGRMWRLIFAGIITY